MWTVRQRYAKFLELWDAFDKVQTEIEDLTDAKSFQALDANRTDRQTFEETYFNVDGVFHELFSKFVKKHDTNISLSERTPYKIKLPPISLPKFSGSTTQYLSFRDTFDSLIHNDENIDSVQKLHFLRSCLEGEAAELVKNLPINTRSYKQARIILGERYENTRTIVNAH